MVFSKVKKIFFLLAIISGLVVIMIFSYFNNDKDELIISFLDVGQGDAILIETPFGQNILVDGGPDNSVIERLSTELSWWDRKIDLMILTHPHDDHLVGQLGVLARYDVKKALYTGVAFDSPAYDEWKNQIADKKISLLLVERPQTIKLGENCRIEILYPDKSMIAEHNKNLNNSSIVLRLVYGDNKFLLTGDAEKAVEETLLDKEVDLKAQILKAGHHGSDTSSSENFLQAVKPESVIISVGENNDFGHPSRRIMARLERMGVKTFLSSLDGTISFICKKQSVCEISSE